MNLPSGTVTFLFSDIEGSTRLWEQSPDAMRDALARHDALLHDTIQAHNGVVFKTVGDAFCAAFSTAPDALAAAVAAQRALHAEPWKEPVRLRVRMALHTGAAEERGGDYFGQPLNRVARLLAIGHGGQTLLSDATQELTRDNLPSGVRLQSQGEHRLRDLARPEQVFQVLHTDLPTEFQPLKSLDNPELPNNLPQQVTSFIGREKELAEVRRLLETTRLLTLIGSGGCGKTRLALQTAADVLDEYRDGVWLAELAPLVDPALIPQTVAQAVGVKEEAGKPIVQTLAEHLKTKQILLVLDNCEHLLPECVRLADALLHACPHVKILATSREALGIAGERTYRAPSLSLPDIKQPVTVESLSQYEATRLFIERAVFHQTAFTVTNANAPALASVCHQLDGIPLAIELAAARIRSLSVKEINARLDHRFRLLTGGSRTALPRQQTLRAMIDWSYDLLNESERLLFRRLAAFAGGGTLSAIEQVCADEELEEWEILDLLSSLVDKSLVSTEAQGENTRYRMLETVREYGRERLQESGTEETIRARHRDYFLALTVQAEAQFRGSEQGWWLDYLASDHDNLRAALAWCREEAEGAEIEIRLVGNLGWFWFLRGYLSEGWTNLEGALARTGPDTEKPAQATALLAAGRIAQARTDYDAAHSLYQEALSLFQEIADRRGEAIVLNNLGLIASRLGDYATARLFYAQSLDINREIGNRNMEALNLNNLGVVAYRQGDHATAHPLYEQALALSREIGHQWAEALSLNGLGRVATDRGDYAAALAYCLQALKINSALGSRQDMAEDLEVRAVLYAAQGAPLRAARLFGAATAIRENIGAPMAPSDREKHENWVAAVRAALGEASFMASFMAGRAMTLEEAEAFALEQVFDPPIPSRMDVG